MWSPFKNKDNKSNDLQEDLNTTEGLQVTSDPADELSSDLLLSPEQSQNVHDQIAAAADNLTFNSGSNVGSLYRRILSGLSDPKVTRETYFNSLTNLEDYYVCKAIIDILTDSIYQDTGTGIEFSVDMPTNIEQDSEEKVEQFNKYREEADDLLKNTLRIGEVLESVTPMLLHYGEYPVSMDVEIGKGVTGLRETYNVSEILSIYDGVYPVAVFRNQSSYPIKTSRTPDLTTDLLGGSSISFAGMNADSKTYAQIPLKSVALFSLSASKLSINLDKEVIKDDQGVEYRADSIKVGRSVFHTVLEQLNRLRLTEVVSDLQVINNATRPVLVGVAVPKDSTDSVKFVRNFEKLLNSGSKTNSNIFAGDITSTRQVMSSLSGSRIKCIPLPESGKGNLSQIETDQGLRSDSVDTKKQITELIDIILDSLGIPGDMFHVSSESSSTQAGQSRYLKRVREYQRNISSTLEFILLTHFVNKYKDTTFALSDFKVTLSATPSMADLDSADLLKQVIENIESIVSLGSTLKDNDLLPNDDKGELVPLIDKRKLIQYLDKELGQAGSNMQTALNTKEIIDGLVTDEDEELKL